MVRLCGADGEKDALSRSVCWCRGYFCGRGGAKKTTEFRRDFHKTGVARTRAQFEDLIAQVDLFDAEAKAEKWRARLAPPSQHKAARKKRAV